MEDFTEFAEARKAAKHQTIQSSATEKTAFIASRLNRDNFWNLMFAFMFFIALASGFIIPQPFGGLMYWIFAIGAIVLVKFNSYITFDKEKLEFTTGQGLKIKKYGVMFIGLLLVSTALAVGIMALFPDVDLKDSVLLKLLLSFFWAFFPSLYCILRNFPIAVYFKKEAWIVDSSNNSYRPGRHNTHSNPSLSLDRLRNDPINSWNSTNIYYRR
jgi:hypothetical protein